MTQLDFWSSSSRLENRSKMGDTSTISWGCSTRFSSLPITVKYKFFLLYSLYIKGKKKGKKKTFLRPGAELWASQRAQEFSHSLPLALPANCLSEGPCPVHRAWGSFVPHFSYVLQGVRLLILALRGIWCLSRPLDLTLRAPIQEGIPFGLMIQRIHGQAFGLCILKPILLQKIQVGAFLRNWHSVAFKWATFTYLFLRICNADI